ncbi:MAG TPA: glycerol kinase, partial [bacterium]|nr:glycerol kinase [bacterium]
MIRAPASPAVAVPHQEEVSSDEKNFRDMFPANLRTDDGHLVRSRAELLIDNWLYQKGIVHAYERRVPVDEEMYCDFFIPIGAKVYIECWGLNDAKYAARKEKKKRLYKKYEKKLIEIDEKDIVRLDDILPLKLRP